MLTKSRKTNILLITLIAVVVATSCKTTASYERPDLGASDSFYGTERGIGDSINLINTPWKSFFGDSLLIALIDTALNNNIDLQIADAYVDIGLAKFNQSKSNFYPSLGAAPLRHRRDYFSENYNNFGSNRARRNYDGGTVPTSFYKERMEYESFVDVSWEVDIWGKLRGQKRRSQLEYMRSLEFQKAVKTSLIAEIAVTYFNLALLKSQIAVYKDNLELNDNTLEIVQLQFDAGEVTSLAVKQTLSQKLRAQTLIPQLEREYTRQENRLNGMMGKRSEPIASSELELPIFNEDYVAGLPVDLITNRPDVSAAEYDLRAAYERMGIADKMRYPSLTIGASAGLNALAIDKLFNPVGSGFLLLNGMIYQPIFQNRKLKTNYEIAKIEKDIASLRFRGAFLRAMNEVSNALVAINKLKEEYTIAQERVEAAQRAVKDASFLFRSGLANYLEVITAQREALDSELNIERVKMQIFSAEVDLYRSLGGGWK